MLRTFALAVFLVVTALPVTAGYKEGDAAYGRGDYKTAFREFKALAEQAHVKAQYALGVMYSFGYGVPKNFRESIKWYRKAAEQGYVEAQYALGQAYANGISGVPRNYMLAYMWLSLSAAQGNNDAAKALALIERFITPAQLTKAQEMAAKWRSTKTK